MEEKDKKTRLYGYIMAAFGLLTLLVSMFSDESNRTTFIVIGAVFIVIGLSTSFSAKKKV